MPRLATFLRTIAHLEPRQALAMLAHRLIPRKPARLKALPAAAAAYANAFPAYEPVRFPSPDVLNAGTGLVSLINIPHSFKQGINWNYAGHGLLWNYHLGYFRWLEGEDASESGLQMLRDFSAKYEVLKAALDPYPSSLRVVYGLLFCIRHNIRDDAVLRLLFNDAMRVRHRPEHHLQANHLLENGLALFAAASFFGTEELQKKGEKILSTELRKQILPDGGHVERSPAYHCSILGRMMQVLEIAEASQQMSRLATTQLLRKTISAMAGWLLAYEPDQIEPMPFGDSPPGEAPLPPALLGAAQKLGITTQPSTLYESGYRRIGRPEWSGTINLSGPQPACQPGHSHADALAFMLQYGGKRLVTDAGVSTYAQGLRRVLERSSRGHSTATFDGRDSSEMWASFRIGRRASVQILSESATRIEAEHNGYSPWGRTHRRTFSFDDAAFRIEDHFLHNGQPEAEPHRWVVRLWFDPSVSVAAGADENTWLADNVRISMDGFSEVSAVEEMTGTGFNQLEPTIVLEGVPAAASTQIHFLF